MTQAPPTLLMRALGRRMRYTYLQPCQPRPATLSTQLVGEITGENRAVLEELGVAAEISTAGGAPSPVTATLPSGDTIQGDHAVSRYICSQHAPALCGAGDALVAADVDQYLAAAANHADAPPDELQPLLTHLDARLATRTFLAGHSLTLADVAMWALFSQEKASLEARASREEQPRYPHAARWLRSMWARKGFVRAAALCQGGDAAASV